MSAFPGSHYCRQHQGNDSIYSPDNCELCRIGAEFKKTSECLYETEKFREQERVVAERLRAALEEIIFGIERHDDTDGGWMPMNATEVVGIARRALRPTHNTGEGE